MTDDALKLPTPRTDAHITYADSHRKGPQQLMVPLVEADFARQLEGVCHALALAIELQYPHKKAIQQYNDLLGDDAQGISGKVFARIFELEREIAELKQPQTSAEVNGLLQLADIIRQLGHDVTAADITAIAIKISKRIATLEREIVRLVKVFDAVSEMGIYPAAILDGPHQYAKRTEKMDGWNDAVMEMHKIMSKTAPELETSYDKLSSYIEKELGKHNTSAHQIEEVIDAASARIATLESQLAEAREDSQRLDWIDQTHFNTESWLRFHGERDIRAAIDAARNVIDSHSAPQG